MYMIPKTNKKKNKQPDVAYPWPNTLYYLGCHTVNVSVFLALKIVVSLSSTQTVMMVLSFIHLKNFWSQVSFQNKGMRSNPLTLLRCRPNNGAMITMF